MPQQPGALVDAQHQDAGGHRVERAGVADLAGADEAADPGHHVVGGQAARLVDHDETRGTAVRTAGAHASSSPSADFSVAPVPVDASTVVVEVVVVLGPRLAVGVGLAGVDGAGRGGRRGGVGLPDLLEQLLEVPGVLRQRVADELQRRRVPDAELLADLGADEPLGRLQRRRRRQRLLLLTEHGVEDAGVLGVTADPHVGHGDEPEPRVLDPPLQHLCHDDLDPVRDLANPWATHLEQFLFQSPSASGHDPCQLRRPEGAARRRGRAWREGRACEARMVAGAPPSAGDDRRVVGRAPRPDGRPRRPPDHRAHPRGISRISNASTMSPILTSW